MPIFIESDYDVTRNETVDVMSFGSGVHVLTPIPAHLIPPLDAYIIGDTLGARVEGGSIFHSKELIDHLEAVRKHSAYMYTVNKGGTDESDMARAMISFKSRAEGADIRALDISWFQHLMRERKSTRYGNSMRRAFAVGRMMGKGCVTEKLREVLRRNNSFGNGCLSIVYPFFLLAKEPPANGHRPHRGIEELMGALINMTRLTHNHGDAIYAVELLFKFFVSRGEDNTLYYAAKRFTDLPDTTALGCLLKAYRLATDERVDDLYDIIELSATCGGDVDSYMSLAFLMHQFVRLHEKNGTHGLAKSPSTGVTFLRDFSISATPANS